MQTIYLAGKIHGLSYQEATEWRDKITDTLKGSYRILDPMDGKEYLDGVDNIPIVTEMSGQEIFKQDIRSVDAADIIVANLNYMPVFGTPFELGYAYAKMKDIYVICDNEYRDHPFMHCALKSFRTVEQFLAFMAMLQISIAAMKALKGVTF